MIGRANRLDLFIKENSNQHYARTYKTEKGAIRAMDKLGEWARNINETLTFHYMLFENDKGRLYPVILVPKNHEDFPALVSIAVNQGYMTI